MYKVDYKPLSANELWTGRRFPTEKYKKFTRDMLFLLPKIVVPEGKLQVNMIIGFSNKLADLDNSQKGIIDILQKKYEFNDSRIYGLNLTKVITEKGKEFISKLKENYSDADENVQFVASIFAMSFAFNAGKFGKFFTDLALKKKEELSETDKEKVDVIIDDLSNEYTQAQQPAQAPAPVETASDAATKTLIQAMAARSLEPQAQAPAVNVKVGIDNQQMSDMAREIQDVAAETLKQIREDVQNMPIVIPAPIVNVAAPQVTVTNTVEPTPVTLEANIQPAEITLNMPTRVTETTTRRDANGELSGSISIEKNYQA